MLLAKVLALILIPSCAACTLLVRGVDNGPGANQWKRGQIVAIYDDKPSYGSKEVAPAFYLIRLPGVPKELVASRWLKDNINEDGEIVRRRVFRFRVADMPLAARNLLQKNGQLVIKVAAYWDNQSAFTAWDYTWAQVRDYFRNDNTGVDGDDI